MPSCRHRHPSGSSLCPLCLQKADELLVGGESNPGYANSPSEDVFRLYRSLFLSLSSYNAFADNDLTPELSVKELGTSKPASTSKPALLDYLFHLEKPWSLQDLIVLPVHARFPGESTFRLDNLESTTIPRRSPVPQWRRDEINYIRKNGGICDNCKANKRKQACRHKLQELEGILNGDGKNPEETSLAKATEPDTLHDVGSVTSNQYHIEARNLEGSQLRISQVENLAIPLDGDNSDIYNQHPAIGTESCAPSRVESHRREYSYKGGNGHIDYQEAYMHQEGPTFTNLVTEEALYPESVLYSDNQALGVANGSHENAPTNGVPSNAFSSFDMLRDPQSDSYGYRQVAYNPLSSPGSVEDFFLYDEGYAPQSCYPLSDMLTENAVWSTSSSANQYRGHQDTFQLATEHSVQGLHPESVYIPFALEGANGNEAYTVSTAHATNTSSHYTDMSHVETLSVASQARWIGNLDIPLEEDDDV